MAESIKVTDQKWPENTQPIVSIFSWVYNHKDYVRESIESILMQKTSFPIEIIIHDDASNDGTKEIIFEYQEKYPNLFRNILQQQNQWSQGKSVMIPLFEKPRGKYLALMHGDDYWTDSYKLQKQVEFLEKNNHYSSVFTNYCHFEQESQVLSNPFIASKNFDQKGHYIVTLDNFLSPYLLKTATCVFRIDIFNKNKNIFKNNPFMCDIFIFSILLQENNGIILKDNSAVYRIHDAGVWSKVSKLQKTKENTYILESMNLHFHRKVKSIYLAYLGTLRHYFLLVLSSGKV
ncbi:MAG: glycosyltransferase, partial [Bacteroidia bacterium]|nr:glycosyltransferase [Bacteroidia bacterium]